MPAPRRTRQHRDGRRSHQVCGTRGLLQPKAHSLQQHPRLNTEGWCDCVTGTAGSLSPIQPQHSAGSSPHGAGSPSPTGAAPGGTPSPRPALPRGCPCRGGCSATGLVPSAAPALPGVPCRGSPLGISAWDHCSGSAQSHAQPGCKPSRHLWLLPSQTKGKAKNFSNKRTQSTFPLQVKKLEQSQGMRKKKACWRLSGL